MSAVGGQSWEDWKISSCQKEWFQAAVSGQQSESAVRKNGSRRSAVSSHQRSAISSQQSERMASRVSRLKRSRSADRSYKEWQLAV